MGGRAEGGPAEGGLAERGLGEEEVNGRGFVVGGPGVGRPTSSTKAARGQHRYHTTFGIQRTQKTGDRKKTICIKFFRGSQKKTPFGDRKTRRGAENPFAGRENLQAGRKKTLGRGSEKPILEGSI